jgi:hypothetical protein
LSSGVRLNAGEDYRSRESEFDARFSGVFSARLARAVALTPQMGAHSRVFVVHPDNR